MEDTFYKTFSTTHPSPPHLSPVQALLLLPPPQVYLIQCTISSPFNIFDQLEDEMTT